MVIGPDGTTASDTIDGEYIVNQDQLIMDTALINESTLKKELEAFYVNEVTAKLNKKENKKEANVEASIKITDSELHFYIPYTCKEASEIIDIINTIKKDIF